MGRPGPVTVLEYEPFPDPSEETVTISARFQNENGMVLREGEACLPRGSAPAFPWTRLGKTGCPACPGKGPWTCLPVIGGTGNRMCFSLGAVIDASTNESGNILAQVLALSPLHKGALECPPDLAERLRRRSSLEMVTTSLCQQGAGHRLRGAAINDWLSQSTALSTNLGGQGCAVHEMAGSELKSRCVS